MSYLKIDKNEIIEAPYKMERNGRIIFGYNKPQNEKMLFEDGFEKFVYSTDNYEIKDGKIIEKVIPEEKEEEPIPTPIEPESPKTIFTKLEIRRAMRQLGFEQFLDHILENNAQFKKDWLDAQEIDLNDPMIEQAIENKLISIEIIEKIKEVLNDQNSI